MPEEMWKLLFLIRDKKIIARYSNDSFILKLNSKTVKYFVDLVTKIYPDYLSDNLKSKWLEIDSMLLEISSIINNFSDIGTFIKNYKEVM